VADNYCDDNRVARWVADVRGDLPLNLSRCFDIRRERGYRATSDAISNYLFQLGLRTVTPPTNQETVHSASDALDDVTDYAGPNPHRALIHERDHTQ
jgi:hypothetical protein